MRFTLSIRTLWEALTGVTLAPTRAAVSWRSPPMVAVASGVLLVAGSVARTVRVSCLALAGVVLLATRVAAS
jgi:hypothetical protein